MRTALKFKVEDPVPKPNYTAIAEKKSRTRTKKGPLTFALYASDGRGAMSISKGITLLLQKVRDSINQIKMRKITDRIFNRKPQVISVLLESSKDVFSSTKISLPAPAGNKGTAEFAPTGINK